MKICLIRHGETDWNLKGLWQGRENIPLNGTGIKQAKKCARLLKEKSYSKIITSPLIRAVQTGHIIGEKLGIDDYSVENDLIECDLGEASGLTRDERRRRYPDKIYPGKEEDSAVGKRMKKCVLEIAEKFPDTDIIIVSHGNAIQNLFRTLFPIPAKEEGEKPDADQGVLRNGCYAVIEFSNSSRKIIEYDVG